MIHPINIPEDLFASNPRRPQLFKPRPKVKISYGADGRRLGPDGAALEPISPGTNWNNVFMRTFIRRLAPQGMELQQQPGTKAEEVNEESGKFGSGGRKPSHVDIVDLSPSPSTSKPPNLMKDEEEEEEEEESEDRNEAEKRKEAPKKSTADSTPDRPSPAAELLPEGSEGEEAEGDQLARMGSSSLPLQPDRALSQLISRRALDAILRCCCPPLAGTEFARLDFSHLNSLFESGSERTAAQLELVPGRRGSRVWTKREKQAAKAEDEQEEAKEVEHRRRRCIRFHIASVLFSRSSVAVRVESHNGLAQQLRLRVETHVHAVRGDQIGQCVQWLAQVEELGAEGETSFSVHIPLGERAQNVLLAQQQRRQGQAEGEAEEQFLMATMHGRILPAEDVVC